MSGRRRLRLEVPEPKPLPWPRGRELNLAGKGRRLVSLAVRPQGTTRAAVARDAAFKAAGNLTPSFAVDVDGVRVYVDTADQEISRLVYIFGLYDKPLMTLAFSALAQLGGPADLRDRRLLDIGANIGTTTLTAIGCFRAEGSYAFEPAPDNFRNLAVNVAANRLGERVRPFEVALSEASGMARLELSASNAGEHRLAGVGRSGGADGAADTVEVRTAALDELAAAGEVDLDRVGVAWLDVQGHEASVLAGAAALLERPIPVVAEYWPEGLREAGGLERFNELAGDAYPAFLDLGGPRGAPNPELLPTSELAGVAGRLTGADHTDVVLLPAALAGRP